MEKWIDEYPHKFYFVHTTLDMKPMPLIFKSGRIDKQKFPYVFFMINFIDLNNIPDYKLFILLKPHILCDHNVIFNDDWNYGIFDTNSIFLRKDATKRELYKNLDKIYTHLKKTTGTHGRWMWSHEFFMASSISLKKYAFGVILYKNTAETEETKKIIKKEKYKIIIKEIDEKKARKRELYNEN